MDVTDITAHLDKLDGNINELEASLKPLLSNLNETASKLPLLDRAKLYVTVAYAIESTLHSALRVGGVDIKTHAISKELARLKQYFEKIKKAEEVPAERTQALDKQAAIRFIKADLADNADINTKLKEKLAKEREKAAARAAAQKGKKRPAEEAEPAVAEAAKAESPAGDSSDEEGEIEEPEKKKSKKSTAAKPKREKKTRKGKKKN
ncbi:putative Lrp1, nuclear exosome-associated nucleic acid binding protein [Cryphonectria parasitica EP155]|uniref:Exosome complex protein n=1 Tax=Cryphonectria parasitica (strain ATCC 38755 / EP155) TaxID=660469 RepID=A0A9P5CPJ8_CRYP1|nr:putative Lrp1, nuclear exosome-associated nucleic acid binding protein [Cryphonectria parasitica EP155]KAF3765080.1 putative Lrp1, nuclear exosome-associated nucleic acid binding protein [Cryphonectria parasitica EP155]